MNALPYKAAEFIILWTELPHRDGIEQTYKSVRCVCIANYA